MLFAFRREHLFVAVIFASVNLLALCDCVCIDKNAEEDDLTITSEKGIFNGDESIERPYGEPRRAAAKIDAFNYDICGKSIQRDWQSREKAWNCGRRRSTGRQRWTARNSSKQRISDGEHALEGEFPSFVHVHTKDKYGEHRTYYCGGTLIHSNLVITAAHCVEDAMDITVVLDSYQQYGRGGYEVKADSWCQHRDYRTDQHVPKFDLGMVRLSRKVDYVENRVWPACLLLDKRHKRNSACAVAGMGTDRDTHLTERLKTLPIRRTCSHYEQHPYRSCYQADSIGSTCRGDSGSGVYCYDDCYAGEQRAFVVAAVSGGHDNKCLPGRRGINFYTDFNWMADSVRAMIDKLVSGGAARNLICSGPTNN